VEKGRGGGQPAAQAQRGGEAERRWIHGSQQKRRRRRDRGEEGPDRGQEVETEHKTQMSCAALQFVIAAHRTLPVLPPPCPLLVAPWQWYAHDRCPLVHCFNTSKDFAFE